MDNWIGQEALELKALLLIDKLFALYEQDMNFDQSDINDIKRMIEKANKIAGTSRNSVNRALAVNVVFFGKKLHTQLEAA